MSAIRLLPAPPTASLEIEPWKQLYVWVWSFLTRYRTLSPHDLEDLVQNVFLALVLHPNALRSPTELRGLAITIARRAVLNWLRQRNRTTNRLRKAWSEEFTDSLVAPPISELERDMEEAMRLMAADTRAVFHAIVIQGMTQKEAGMRLGMTRSHVRHLSAEARNFLRRLWKADVSRKNSRIARQVNRRAQF